MTIERPTKESTHSEGTKAENLRLGAVSYLNMLPFFTGLSQFKLLPSPRALTSHAPQFDAYCSSLIAGLKNGQMPISTSFGVFSSGPVMSVFIEPVFHNNNHQTFWNQLSEFWSQQHTSPITALTNSEAHGKIILRTSGDSAQSVWMFEVLCALAGFQLEVMSNDNNSVAHNSKGKPFPEARLFIGDNALWQRKNAPNSLRLDLGTLWTRHVGCKAWFAAWFGGQKDSLSSLLTLENILQNQISDWQKLSEFSRWCKCLSFIEQEKCGRKELSNFEDTFELRELLADYFGNLEHQIPEEEGIELLKLYVEINAALEQWCSAQSNHTHAPSQSPAQLSSPESNIHFSNT